MKIRVWSVRNGFIAESKPDLGEVVSDEETMVFETFGHLVRHLRGVLKPSEEVLEDLSGLKDLTPP